MKKIIHVLFVVGTISSCSQPSPSLCECVEYGNKVNELSAQLMNVDNRSKVLADSLETAKKYRDSLCNSFNNMLPEKLHEKAKECESLQFSPE